MPSNVKACSQEQVFFFLNLNFSVMYLNNLQQDEIFVPSEMKPLESITGIQSRKGLENVIVSNGKVVNVVTILSFTIVNSILYCFISLLP